MLNSQEITRHTKKQGNIVQSKGQDKPPESEPQRMKICELPDKKFKTVIKKINVLQENTDRKLNEIKKIRHE